ncbi:MAG: amidohydrolase family protein [Deltaproteobacteria bacterium]|nr:amidohydrolase family protein [Deltaproteobacteria bacterium]
MGTVLIENIGTVASGDLAEPILNADSLFLAEGVIQEMNTHSHADLKIDACGSAVMPGLIDAHHHPYFGDFHPVVNAVGYTDRYMESGVTGLVSCGPYALPGHPLGPQAGVALGILSAQSFAKVRPSGIKVYGECMIVEPGMNEADFSRAAAGGVKRIKFLLPVPTAEMARNCVGWAHNHGMKVLTHCGGRKLVGEAKSIGEALQIIRPDVAAHLNGGPTPPYWEDAAWLLDETPCAADIVFGGNLGIAVKIVEKLMGQGRLDRLMLGTDSPTPGGMMAGGVAKFMAFLASTSDLGPEQAVCLATGVTARTHGLNTGVVKVGMPADLLIVSAKEGTPARDALEEIKDGNPPAVGAVIVDGELLHPPAHYPSGRYVGRSNPKQRPVIQRR